MACLISPLSARGTHKIALFDPVNWVTLTTAELVEGPTVDISIIVWLLPVIVGGILLFSALT